MLKMVIYLGTVFPKGIQAALVLSLLTCFFPKSRLLEDAEKKVAEGWYEDFFFVSSDGGEFRHDVARWRKEIEKDKSFLKRLARKFFPVPEESEFEFKFVGRDTVNRYLFLRYFAHLPDPEGTIAGWQVLFIFRERDKACEKILVSEVPLE